MSRTEKVELTVLRLLQNEDAYLLQNRIKADWRGFTLPGGHVEDGESIVDAVIREMREETGLTVLNPRLRGVKQFPIDGGRYLVFLFGADKYEGVLSSSIEGEMRWIKKDELPYINTVDDLAELLRVILDENLNEFQYIIDGAEWKVLLK